MLIRTEPSQRNEREKSIEDHSLSSLPASLTPSPSKDMSPVTGSRITAAVKPTPEEPLPRGGRAGGREGGRGDGEGSER